MILPRLLFTSKATVRWTGPESGGRVGRTAAWVGKLNFPAFTGKIRFARYHHIERFGTDDSGERRTETRD